MNNSYWFACVCLLVAASTTAGHLLGHSHESAIAEGRWGGERTKLTEEHQQRERALQIEIAALQKENSREVARLNRSVAALNAIINEHHLNKCAEARTDEGTYSPPKDAQHDQNPDLHD